MEGNLKQNQKIEKFLQNEIEKSVVLQKEQKKAQRTQNNTFHRKSNKPILLHTKNHFDKMKYLDKNFQFTKLMDENK